MTTFFCYTRPFFTICSVSITSSCMLGLMNLIVYYANNLIYVGVVQVWQRPQILCMEMPTLSKYLHIQFPFGIWMSLRHYFFLPIHHHPLNVPQWFVIYSSFSWYMLFFPKVHIKLTREAIGGSGWLIETCTFYRDNYSPNSLEMKNGYCGAIAFDTFIYRCILWRNFANRIIMVKLKHESFIHWLFECFCLRIKNTTMHLNCILILIFLRETR